MAEVNTLSVQILGYPNFYVCDNIYGTNLRYQDCFYLASNLPSSTIPVPYSSGSQGSTALPIQAQRRSCYLTVETSGGSPDSRFWLPPSDIRALALSVVSTCVRGLSGQGGFATYGFANAAVWSIEPDAIATQPSEASHFLTVTISGAGGRRFYPGAYDPEIPLALAAYSASQVDRTKMPGSNGLDSAYWTSQAEQMQRGGTLAWWVKLSNQAPSEMTYQCDTALGSPSSVDCSQVEWSQLRSTNPSSETVSIGPGVMFLHSNTCYLAISSSVAVVLQWAQIRTAVETLMEICIQHPFQASQGGRAHFELPAKGEKKLKRDWKRKRQSSTLTGLNALPPPMNIVMFEQQEAWTNPTAELDTCTWLAVKRGTAVSACNK